MSRLTWGDISSRQYQAGVDQGVFYNASGRGKAWNGLVSVVESNEDESTNFIYLDGIKLTNRKRFGDFTAAIEAFAYPEELDANTQQPFGFSYRVFVGDHYQIHLVYNANVSFEDRALESVSRDTSVSLVSMKVTTLKTIFDGVYKIAHLVVDTYNEAAIAELESILYGSPEQEPYLPTPELLLELFESHAMIRVTDNFDGSFTISGPDDLVYWVDSTTFEVNSPGVIWLDSDIYSIKST